MCTNTPKPCDKVRKHSGTIGITRLRRRYYNIPSSPIDVDRVYGVISPEAQNSENFISCKEFESRASVDALAWFLYYWKVRKLMDSSSSKQSKLFELCR